MQVRITHTLPKNQRKLIDTCLIYGSYTSYRKKKKRYSENIDAPWYRENHHQ